MTDAAPSPAAPEGATVAPAESSAASPAGGAAQADPLASHPKGAPGSADPEQEREALSGRRPIKPIPPAGKRPSLPGVITADDADDFAQFVGGRDSKGRFVGKPGSAEGAAPAAPLEAGGAGDKPVPPPTPEGEAAKPAPVALTPDPTSGKVKFADKEYDSPAQIEQEFRTLRGMFKPMNDRVVKLTEERDYGYSTAQAWIKEVEKRDAIIAELQGGGAARPGSTAAAPAADPSALPSADAIVEGLDMDVFEAIAVEGGLPAAGRYLSQQILGSVLEKVVPALRAQQEAALAPITSARQAQQAEANLQAVADSVAALQAPDGTMAFPELGDAVAMGKVAQMWQAAGLPPEVAMTPGGLMAAISMYRTAHGMQNRTSAPVVAPPTAPAPPSPVAAPAIAASVGDDRGGMPGSGRSHMPRAHAALLSGLADIQLVDRALGFQKNQRGASI